MIPFGGRRMKVLHNFYYAAIFISLLLNLSVFVGYMISKHQWGNPTTGVVGAAATEEFNQNRHGNTAINNNNNANYLREHRDSGKIIPKAPVNAAFDFAQDPKKKITFSKNFNQFRELSILQTKEEIEEEMKGYQFHGEEEDDNNDDVERSMNDLLMEEGGQPIRNVICTSWRSGSTFVGAVVDSHPATFYHYEPLMHFGVKQLHSEEDAKEGLRVITNLFHCNYTTIPDYMELGNVRNILEWRFRPSSRLWKHCGKNRKLCLDPEYLSNICRIFPFQSMKTVRMRLRIAKTLLEDPKLNIRMLFLIRDPRGVLQSRLHEKWCTPDSPDCTDPTNVCMDMVDDFYEAEMLRVQYPERFLPIRYEDLMLHPYEAFHRIFKLFRLQFHPKVEKYLGRHTTIATSKDRSSTNPDGTLIKPFSRISKVSPFHWIKDFSKNFSFVQKIQNSCGKAMNLWGYKEAKDEMDLRKKFNSIVEPPWAEMKLDD